MGNGTFKAKTAFSWDKTVQVWQLCFSHVPSNFPIGIGSKLGTLQIIVVFVLPSPPATSPGHPR